MKIVNSLEKEASRYVYNDCTAFLLISAHVIYTIAIGMLMMTEGGLLKKVTWKDEHFRKIVYWSLSDSSIRGALQLLYCWKSKNTTLKTAALIAGILPVVPLFSSLAGHEILKERDGQLAALFIALAIMSLVSNSLLLVSFSRKSIRLHLRSHQEIEIN